MSSSAATGATDPNGWMTPGAQPGSVIVKIINTSRETMNGQLAVVLAYVEDKGRYVIHTTLQQQQVSLKPENLVKASWMEQMKGQFEMIQNHPEIRQKLTQAYNTVQTRTGLKPEYVAAGLLVGLLAAIYFVGFSKVLLTVSFVILVLTVIAPDLNSNVSTIARNFPMRARAMIRQHIPVVGSRIADNQYLSMAVVGLIVVFFVNALVRSPTTTTSAAATASSADIAGGGPHLSATTAGAAKPNRALLEEYYQLGFKDGLANNEFGTSLPVPVEEQDPSMTSSSSAATTARGVNEFDDLDLPPPPPPRKSSSSGGFDWSTMLSLGYVGQTIYSLGSTAGGAWDYQLAIANVRSMEPMRMGFLAFSLYRLVSKLF